jgi:hydrogenase expression/formation protein HypC
VCLAYVPEAEVGSHVIVHAGFAISRIDEEAARRVLSYLEEIDAAEEDRAARRRP